MVGRVLAATPDRDSGSPGSGSATASPLAVSGGDVTTGRPHHLPPGGVRGSVLSGGATAGVTLGHPRTKSSPFGDGADSAGDQRGGAQAGGGGGTGNSGAATAVTAPQRPPGPDPLASGKGARAAASSQPGLSNSDSSFVLVRPEDAAPGTPTSRHAPHLSSLTASAIVAAASEHLSEPDADAAAQDLGAPFNAVGGGDFHTSLPHRDRKVLKNTFRNAYALGLQASAVTELAYQIEGLRVNPLSAYAGGSSPKLGFGGFLAMPPYVGASLLYGNAASAHPQRCDRMVPNLQEEERIIALRRAQALSLYNMALALFHEGLQERANLPHHLAVLVVSTDGGQHDTASDSRRRGSLSTGSHRIVQRWRTMHAWLVTCCDRCLQLAEDCSAAIPHDFEGLVREDELLHAHALRVGARTSVKENLLRSALDRAVAVSTSVEGRRSREGPAGSSDATHTGSDPSSPVLPSWDEMAVEAKQLSKDYSQGALLLRVLSRLSLTQADEAKLARLSRAFGKRLKAVKGLRSELSLRREVLQLR